MGQTIFRREYHRTRIAMKQIHSHAEPFFGWGRHSLFYDVHPRYVFLRSRRFADEESAKWWAATQPDGTHYSVKPYYSSGYVRWADIGRSRREFAGYRASLYRYEGPPFRQSGATWEAEEIQRQHDIQSAKKAKARGSYQTHGAGGKDWRQEGRRKVRAQVRAALHEVQKGDLDAAELVYEPRQNYLRDYW